MPDIWITALLMVVCLIAEGFFSGSELGVVSADRMKLRHDAAKGSRGARLALEMLEKRPEWLLSTTLVGTNIAVVANSTIATALMISLFGEAGSWLAVVLVAPLIWVFGEIVPKSVFQQRADTITPYVIYVLRFFSILFWPILIIFVTLSKFLSRLAGSRDEHNPFTLREQIQSMVQMPPQEGGDIQAIEKTMIRRMFNFSETTVYKVMVPLIDVNAIEKGSTVGEAVRLACSARTSACRSTTGESTASSACSTPWTCSAWTSLRRSNPSSARRATFRRARAPSRCSSNCARMATRWPW
jgi:putative hemolysin